MQFINIIVHSVQDMNYRVYLQEEFKLLGLDECLKVSLGRGDRNLETLLVFVQKYLEIHSECDLLILQIHAFLDNYFDVGQLLEDSETKQQAIGKVAELEEQLGVVSLVDSTVMTDDEWIFLQAHERIQELGNGSSSKLGKTTFFLQNFISSAFFPLQWSYKRP